MSGNEIAVRADRSSRKRGANTIIPDEYQIGEDVILNIFPYTAGICP